MKKNKTKKIIIFAVFFAVLFCFNLKSANANPFVSLLGTKVGEKIAKGEKIDVLNELSDAATWGPRKVILISLKVIAAFVALLLDVANKSLEAIISEDFVNLVFFSSGSLEALNVGWELVRDFVNMFYVLILLFLAIATILGVNKYSDKKLLVSVVGSAIFVNFSKSITLFFIDVSNLAMNFFQTGIENESSDYGAFMLKKADVKEIFTATTSSDIGEMAFLIVEIIFMAIFAIIILALFVALLVRLISFWVLIVLSPLAFFGLAVPGTGLNSLFQDWFKKLIGWVFFGPVLLFFLWLAMIILGATASAIKSTDITIDASASNISYNLTFIIPYIVAIYMLYYGFNASKGIAQQAGPGATKALDWGYDKAMKPVRAGKKYGKEEYKNVKEGAGLRYENWAAKRKGISRVLPSKIRTDSRRKATKIWAAGPEAGKGLLRQWAYEAAEKDKKEGKVPDKKTQEKLRNGSARERAEQGYRDANNAVGTRKPEEIRSALDSFENDAYQQNKNKGTLVKNGNLKGVIDYEIEKLSEVIETGNDDLIKSQIDNNSSLMKIIAEEEKASGEMSEDQKVSFVKKIDLGSDDKKSNMKNRAGKIYAAGMSLEAIVEKQKNLLDNEGVMEQLKERVSDPKGTTQWEDIRRVAVKDGNSIKLNKLKRVQVVEEEIKKAEKAKKEAEEKKEKAKKEAEEKKEKAKKEAEEAKKRANRPVGRDDSGTTGVSMGRI